MLSLAALSALPRPKGYSMQALVTALIFFGSFLVIGALAKWWLNRRAVDLSEVQTHAAPDRGKRQMFLLGFWRSED